MASVAPVAEKVITIKGDTMKTIYKHILVDNTRTNETSWSRTKEFEIKFGPNRKVCLRGRI